MKKYGFLIVGVLLGMSVIGTALASSDTEQTPDVIVQPEITPDVTATEDAAAINETEMVETTDDDVDVPSAGTSDVAAAPIIVETVEFQSVNYRIGNGGYNWVYKLHTSSGDIEPINMDDEWVRFEVPIGVSYELTWEESGRLPR